jgi:MoxR-like ATPase
VESAPVKEEQDSASVVATLIDVIGGMFRGKRDVVELSIVGLLAEGHLLFEDVPGVGKTTLAKALASALGCSFQRIQFTSDLLPSDVLGVSIYEPQKGTFHFNKGPVFANLVLADEINRTTPRSQSSLLEVMNERQVTIDRTTHTLPRPFMVMATQNPLEFTGTYPLPESQMDRFIMRLSIGYPSPEVERDVILARGFEMPDSGLEPVLQAEDVIALQQQVKDVKLGDRCMAYLQRLVGKTRESPYLSLGVSVRGAISLSRAAQSLAFVRGREYVLPDDIKYLFVAVCGHRVIPKNFHDSVVERRRDIDNVLGEMLDSTEVPV